MRRGHRLFAAAIFTMLGACAEDSPVRVADPEPSSPSPSPPASASPTPSITATPAIGGKRPDRIVAIDEDGRLLLVDADGNVEKVLARYDDPSECPKPGEPFAGCAFIVELALDPAGDEVFFEVCCEPAPDVIYRVPLTGGKPKRVTYGAYPALNAGGELLAHVELQWVAVFDLSTEEVQRFDTEQPPPALEGMSWSPDGTKVAFARFDDRGRAQINILDVTTANDLDDAVELSAPKNHSWTLPVFRSDGMLVVVQQDPRPQLDTKGPARSLIVDPATGLVVDEFDPGGLVLAQHIDATGTYLIFVLSDGSVGWRDINGEQGILGAGGFTAAAW